MNKDYVLLITSPGIGKGEEKLGKKLMTSYLHCLNEGEDLPSHILFLHEGVKLVVEETPVLTLLQSLAAKGVKILACGTCLDYFQIKDQVKVGEIGNMYGTRDILAWAGKVITIG
ncbi:sulfurtransferase-like selenium metabolism protein YedF [Thermanaerosceptrum fracticalcis]|uniref:Sulfurtransferase-like selenium metabolism protein YedF n=1 Tax=Thermanaerosceptrum fracticalcis TaxID=1712410 RepID=A0A7G6E7J5_THEFR|nr:sulfurtransferase-like selenium metabolism protein YedF [Thermanaerosceptrum fracticalcis]QNB48049.1 sulfurtransferase-like selenium metabolism protein YedF [Thermanaerosceptrum fracticalcis]